MILIHRDAKKMSIQDWNKYTHPYGDVFLSGEFKNNFVSIGWHSGYFLYGNKESTQFEAIKAWGKKYLKPKPRKKRKKQAH